MTDREHLAARIDTALRQADGLAGIFGDYTRQINALLPLFDSYAHELAEKIRTEAGEWDGWPEKMAAMKFSADLIDPKVRT